VEGKAVGDNMKSKRTFAEKIRYYKRYLPLYLMMLPALIYLFINNYLPMSGLVLAFEKYNVKDGIWGSQFVGFKNFTFLLKNNDLPILFRNTLGYNLCFILINLVLGVTLAILITEITNLKFRKAAQSSILFPFVVSIVIVSYMVRAFLDPEAGLLNHLLVSMGHQKVAWYDTAKYWPFILIFVNTWKGVGYGCILYISSILGIDMSLYESASLDGATKFQKIRYITLPFLKPTMITVSLLSLGRVFNSDFGLFFQVPQNSGLISSTTQTIDTFVYNVLITQSNVGMSAAASFFQSVMGFLMIMVFNAITRKISRENALF
jgi:putative aldouronate transport system permease protein